LAVNLNIGKDQEIHEIAEKNNLLSWQGTKHKAGPPQAATGAGIDRQDAGLLNPALSACSANSAV